MVGQTQRLDRQRFQLSLQARSRLSNATTAGGKQADHVNRIDDADVALFSQRDNDLAAQPLDGNDIRLERDRTDLLQRDARTRRILLLLLLG